MIDMDPGLDTKLRAFFDRIEASPPSSALAGIKARPSSRRRRTLNLVAGLAAVTVIAASVALFAVELSNHHGKAAPSLPASAAHLVKLPLFGNGQIPASAHVLIPLKRGHGPAQLKTFVPRGTLLIQFGCVGSGPFSIHSTNGVIHSTVEECSTPFELTLTEGAVPSPGECTSPCPSGYDGKPLTLDITASSSMSWEIVVAETTVWFPATQPPTADSQALIATTFGAGSTTLQSFYVSADENVNASVLCTSPTAGKTLEIAPNPLWPDGQQIQCFVFNPAGGTSVDIVGPAVSTTGRTVLGPISLQLTTDPSVSWEVQVSQGPTGIVLPELGNLGPVTQSVGVAPAEFGMSSASLPSFTPPGHYTMAFSCSGPGSLTIVIGGVAHLATSLCGGHTGWFTLPNQVPGKPLALSVEASRSVGWEIQAEQVYGSTWGAGGPSMSNNS